MKKILYFFLLMSSVCFAEDILPYDIAPIWAQSLFFQKYHLNMIHESVKNILRILEERQYEMSDQVHEILSNEMFTIVNAMGAHR